MIILARFALLKTKTAIRHLLYDQYSMQVNAILDKLYARHRFGIKPGLDRILQLLHAIGNPQLDLPCIHVAGTNGKGSTASLCASMLQSKGLRVGLYTSPHIIRFNERIRVNGVQISDEELVASYLRIEEAAEQCEATFFEITTAIAFDYFKKAKTDICVLECGMGGRFDATNVVLPLVSIITSIDLDHQEYLGTTLEEICLEKCGIIKHHVPIVCAEPRLHLRDIIATEAASHEATYLYAPDLESVDVLGVDEFLGSKLRIHHDGIEDSEVTSPLSGVHQLRNLQAALTAMRVLPSQFQPSLNDIKTGVESVKVNSGIRGRTEVLSQDPLVIVDVAHNTACVQMLVQTLAQSPHSNRRFDCIMGLMADKDLDAILVLLKPWIRQLHAVQPTITRARNKDDIARRAAELGIEAVVNDSIEHCVYDVINSRRELLICGSFYVVEEALPAAEKVLGK